MTALQKVVPIRDIPKKDKFEMSAAVYAEQSQTQTLDVLGNLSKALQVMTIQRRKERALFLVALIQPQNVIKVLEGIEQAQAVVLAFWETGNLFIRHHLAHTVGKYPASTILDELSPGQLVSIATKLNYSAQWSVKELEIQGECWK